MAYAQRADNYPPNNKTITIGSTNLPIVWVEVNGAMILKTEYITAHMKIIHNGSGNLNYGDTVAHPGQTIDYEGYIALRYRGNSSFNHSRKPYLFRPLDKPLEDGGEKKKVKILGMGKDNKWALLAPYSDRSMVRVPLSFDISRPWMEYAPQCRFCELYLDGIYYGVYILTEVGVVISWKWIAMMEMYMSLNTTRGPLPVPSLQDIISIFSTRLPIMRT